MALAGIRKAGKGKERQSELKTVMNEVIARRKLVIFNREELMPLLTDGAGGNKTGKRKERQRVSEFKTGWIKLLRKGSL